MAEPRDEMAAGAGGRGHLRASHADREEVVGLLKTAFMQGRLAKDEFDLRVGQALAARTWADLGALIADLPAGLTAVRQPSVPGRRAVVRPSRVITAATALYASVWAVLLLFPNGAENPPVGPLAADGTLVYLGVLIFCVATILHNRRDRPSGDQPPGRPGADGPASGYRPPAARNGFRPTDWMGYTGAPIRRSSPSF